MQTQINLNYTCQPSFSKYFSYNCLPQHLNDKEVKKSYQYYSKKTIPFSIFSICHFLSLSYCLIPCLPIFLISICSLQLQPMPKVSYIITKMFNNFTPQSEYQPANTILDSSPTHGALLLGDFNSATDQSLLAMHSIKTIITAAMGLQHLQIPSSITHIVYPIQDVKNQNIRAYFDESYLTIQRKLGQGGVLVHCAAGISRSATLVIAYLMRKNMIGFKAAIGIVRAKRAGVCPNLGFEMQLKRYETELIGDGRQQPKLMKKNISEKQTDDKRKSFDVKKIDNSSMFDFQPLHTHQKKVQVKKGITRHTAYSKPKQKPIYDVMQTQLFISGKSAKRPASQVRNTDAKEKIASGRRDPLMGTWGPMTHKSKQFQF